MLGEVVWYFKEKEGNSHGDEKKKMFGSQMFARPFRDTAAAAAKLLQSCLKEINPEYSSGTDAKAEAPILWPPVVKSLLIRKDPHVG